MKKSYLELYYKWMENGRIPGYGLCNSISWSRQLHLLAPYSPDGYWGYDGKSFPADGCGLMQTAMRDRGINADEARHAFTPLRQTIVLFLAAMNNEL